MTSRQVDCILALAKTRNFNRAAESLFLSQPTITYQINAAEEEVGFRIFDRSSKGASLTPAGHQFVTELEAIQERFKRAVEQGQNFSVKYREDIRIALPIRSAVYYLPEAIRRFAEQRSDVLISPYFNWDRCKTLFFRGDQDILFAMEHEMIHVPDLVRHHLFDSGIYLITTPDDPLSLRRSVEQSDLDGRTLMVGGGSPPALQTVQNRVIASGRVAFFNSHDHDTTLTNVAAGRGVCLAPGFLNDHNSEFAWTPFVCTEVIPCALYTHKDDRRNAVREFVELLQAIYSEMFCQGGFQTIFQLS